MLWCGGGGGVGGVEQKNEVTRATAHTIFVSTVAQVL